MNPNSEAAVRKGDYRNRSIAIDRVENGFKVAHVGWLGAVAPAVQGLAPVRFSVSEPDRETIHSKISFASPPETPKTNRNLLSKTLEKVDSGIYYLFTKLGNQWDG